MTVNWYTREPSALVVNAELFSKVLYQSTVPSSGSEFPEFYVLVNTCFCQVCADAMGEKLH